MYIEYVASVPLKYVLSCFCAPLLPPALFVGPNTRVPSPYTLKYTTLYHIHKYLLRYRFTVACAITLLQPTLNDVVRSRTVLVFLRRIVKSWKVSLSKYDKGDTTNSFSQCVSVNRLCLMILNCPEGNIYNLTEYVRSVCVCEVVRVCRWSILYRI